MTGMGDIYAGRMDADTAKEWDCWSCDWTGGGNPDCDHCNPEAMAEAAHPDNDPRIP